MEMCFIVKRFTKAQLSRNVLARNTIKTKARLLEAVELFVEWMVKTMDAIGLFVLRVVQAGTLSFMGCEVASRRREICQGVRRPRLLSGRVFCEAFRRCRNYGRYAHRTRCAWSHRARAAARRYDRGGRGQTARDKKFDVNEREEEMLFASIAVLLALSGAGELARPRSRNEGIVRSSLAALCFARRRVRGRSVPALFPPADKATGACSYCSTSKCVLQNLYTGTSFTC